MMRSDSFGRSVVFAALAAALWLPWAVLVVPIAGMWWARVIYLTVSGAVYFGNLRRHHARPLSRRARTLVRELFLIGGGLIFARFLAGAGLASTAFAIWGFYLVQSLYFLAGGAAHARLPMKEAVDPFDEAHRRALAVLDGSV